MYRIWDSQAQSYLPKLYSTRKLASRAAERLNQEYGAVRYVASIYHE